jgi:hypothetical protein
MRIHVFGRVRDESSRRRPRKLGCSGYFLAVAALLCSIRRSCGASNNLLGENPRSSMLWARGRLPLGGRRRPKSAAGDVQLDGASAAEKAWVRRVDNAEHAQCTPLRVLRGWDGKPAGRIALRGGSPRYAAPGQPLLATPHKLTNLGFWTDRWLLTGERWSRRRTRCDPPSTCSWL